MAISINWATKVIAVPQADLTFISGSLYELDVNVFRLALKGLEDDEAGMPYLRTHNHNTTVTVGGATLARVVEIINGYTVTFQDGQYSVRCVGANHNIADVKNVNQVSLIIGNSAGLLVSGSGVTAQDKLDIAGSVGAIVIEPQGGYSLQQALSLMLAVMAGRTTNGGMVFKTPDGVATRIVATVNAESERVAMEWTPG